MTHAWFSMARARSKVCQWSFPVKRECGRHGKQGGALVAQRAVQLRKAQVEADAQAETTDRCVGHDHVCAASSGVALFEAHIAGGRQVHVEEMHLPVVGQRLPSGPKSRLVL